MRFRRWTGAVLLVLLLTLMVDFGAAEPPPPEGVPRESTPLPPGQRESGGGGLPHLSVAGASFVSADSDNSYAYETMGGVKLTASSVWPYMTAPVHLPDGATVQSVTLYYSETDILWDINLQLVQYDGLGGSRIMAATGSASDGTSSTVETSIISPTVQNFLYSYALVAELEAPGLVLYGARIEYIDSAPTPRSPSSASSLLPGASDPAVLDIQTAEVGQALHTGGEVTLLAPAAEPEGGAGPVPVPEDGLRLLGGGGPTSRWETHAVGGGAFHPEDSSTDYHDFAGGFYLTSAPTSTAMIAPLDLIDNKTIWRVRFTYWDESAHNPYLLLYQVDRQGSGTYIWAYIPLASGGYFEAVSPSLGLAIDNENYAYYFKVILGGSAVSTNLIALEVEVSYVEEVFLPLVLRDDGGLPR